MNRIELRSKRAGRPYVGAVGLFLLSAFMVSSAAAQDAHRGHQIAARWCSSCHAVDKNGASQTVAPSFMSIARRHREDEKWLRAWLMTPHPSMPDMSLSRIEINDIVAYLKTLAKP